MPEPTIHHTAIQAVWVKSSWVKTASRAMEGIAWSQPGHMLGSAFCPLVLLIFASPCSSTIRQHGKVDGARK